MYHDQQTIARALEAQEAHPRNPRTYQAVLGPADSAWNPTSTKGHDIDGPASITYALYPDGGMDVSVR